MIINSNDIHEVLSLSKSEEISFIGNGEATSIVGIKINDDDLNQTIKKVYNGGTGEFSINKDILKLVPKNCEVEITKDMLTVGKRKIKYKENGEVIEPIEVKDYLATINGNEFKHLLSCEYAMSKDNTRPIIKGICIDRNKFIAIDGYRMAIREGSFEAKEEVVVNANIIPILKKIKLKDEDKIEIYYNDTYIKFIFRDLEIIGIRQQGKFIKYDSIIPKEFETTITLESEGLLKILKDYKKNKLNVIVFDFIDKEELKICSKNENLTIEENYSIEKFEGKPLRIAFNISYLIDILKFYENPTLNFINENSPMLIETDDKLDLVLPIRIPKNY